MTPPNPNHVTTKHALRLYVYRSPTLMLPKEGLRRVEWERDRNLSMLGNFAIRAITGDLTKEQAVYELPIVEAVGDSYTDVRRAFIFYANGPTCVLSPVRIRGLRGHLAFSFSLRASTFLSTPGGLGFDERVARQAREVADACARLFSMPSE